MEIDQEGQEKQLGKEAFVVEKSNVAGNREEERIFGSGTTFGERFLTFGDRMNRKRYLYRFAILHGGVLLWGIVATLFFTLFNEESVIGGAVNFMTFLLGLFSAIYQVLIARSRLHDMEKPLWYAVGLFIPLVNLYVYYLLMFKPGTVGPNSYGADPLTLTGW